MTVADYFFRRGDRATAEQVMDLMLSQPRNDSPAIAFDAFFSGALPASNLPQVLAHAWTSAEYPENSIDAVSWTQMFRAAGYAVDGVAAEPPAEVTLYRGGTDPRRMAWTSNVDVARRFAVDGLRGRPRGSVYAVTVPGSALLAAITTRSESEYVVDPAALRAAGVHQLEPAE